MKATWEERSKRQIRVTPTTWERLQSLSSAYSVTPGVALDLLFRSLTDVELKDALRRELRVEMTAQRALQSGE